MNNMEADLFKALEVEEPYDNSDEPVPITLVDQYGVAAACSYGVTYPKIKHSKLKFLLGHGYILSEQLATTMAQYSIKNGDLVLFKIIHENSDVLFEQAQKDALLKLSFKYCRERIAQFLITIGADINSCPLKSLMDLFWITNSDLKPVKIAIKFGADVNLRYNDLTPLELALIRNSHKTAECLVQNGATVYEFMIKYAVEKHMDRMVKVLRKRVVKK